MISGEKWNQYEALKNVYHVKKFVFDIIPVWSKVVSPH